MNPDQRFGQLLQCLIQVIARAAIPEERVRSIVATGRKQITAFNLCDGTRTLTEVARKARLDQGNFSRAATRWVQSGVAFRIGEGRDTRLLHIFPIAPNLAAARKNA